MFRVLFVAAIVTGLVSCSTVEPISLPNGVKFIESHSPKDDEIGVAYNKYQLDNGLTVIFHEDNSDPLTYVNVTYHVGSAREEPGMSGFAHFFEHMMFQGSVHAPNDLHTKLVDAMGGNINGGTNSDSTRYYNTVPANELEKMLWLEADRMGFLLPAVTQEKFEVQRATVKNERAQRYDNAPYGMVWETTSRAMYPPEHPYAWPTIGYVEDLNRVGLNDLRAFFLRWYGPNNATLVVGGDFNQQDALNWVAKYFGSIPRGPEVEQAPKQPVVLEQDRYVTLPDNIHLPLLQMSFPTVYVQHPDEAPLDFLSQLLGDGKTSLLYEKLVKTGLAVQAGASHPCQELACTFNVYAIANPASGASLSDLEGIIRNTLDEWAQQQLEPQALEKYQRMFKADTVFSLESVAGKSSQLATNQTLFNNPDTVAYDLNRYGSVTPEDVKRVFSEYLVDRGAVVLSVVPEGQIESAAKPQNYMLPDALKPTDAQLAHSEVKAPEINDSFDRSALPPTGGPIEVTPPKSWDLQLKNGIAVKGASNSEIPIVSVLLSIEGGPLLDPKDKAGVAAFTAAMMTESSQIRSSEELADALESMGSSVRFSAAGRSTNVSITSLVEFLPETLEIAEEMLFTPGFTEADFMRLKQQKLQLLKNAETNPKSVAGQAKRQLLWGKQTRLGTPDGGTLASVQGISLDDVKAYYHANYSSKMASIVVVGDIQPSQTKNALAFLEQWQGETLALPEATAGVTSHQGKIMLVDHPGAAQAVMVVSRPSLPFDATGDYFKLGLVNYPFGGSFSSRANQVLREQKGYTYGAFSGFSGGKQQGNFSLSANLLQEQTTEAVLETLTLLSDYAQQGPTDVEIENMRSAVTQGEALSYESTRQKASLLRRIQLYDLADNFSAQQTQIIETIPNEVLAKLAQQWMDPKQMFVLIVADAKTVEADLHQIEGWTVERWSVK